MHHVDDNADDHVEEGKRGEKDKTEVEDPAHRVHGHRFIHDIGPVLEGHDAEQGQHGDRDIAPQGWIDRLEQGGADCGIDVEDDEHQQDHVAELGQRLEQRGEQHAQFGDDRDHAQHPKHPHQSGDQDQVTVVDRDQADCHDQRIEYVPAVLEKSPFVGFANEADGDFGDENHRDQHIQPDDQRAAAWREFVSLGPHQQRRANDHRDHEQLESLVAA